MQLNEYQEEALKTAIYRDKVKDELGRINYCTLGLVGEAGELANKLKKLYRDNYGKLDPSYQAALASELGDVIWYVAMLSHELHLELNTLALVNLSKLNRRKEQGTLQGSGDQR